MQLTRPQILAVYDQGPEAVVALQQQAQAHIDVLTEQVHLLSARVKALEDLRAQDSHNSSKAPSSDWSRPAPKSLRPKSERKPGGQPGHRGETLLMVQTPDTVVEHRPGACTRCGTSLAQEPAQGYHRRQVLDLPPIRIQVAEHRALSVCCPRCAHQNEGVFPDQVAHSVQYGARIKALGAYLMGYQLLPYGRTHELLVDLFGASPSPGTLHTVLVEAHQRLSGCEHGLSHEIAQIRAALLSASVLHVDETGFFVQAKRCWLHVRSSARLTYYRWHAHRGRRAIEAIGLLADYDGTVVHDGLRTYQGYACGPGLCNGHHLRELTFIEERFDQAWASRMKTLLLEMKASVEAAKACEAVVLEASVLATFRRRYGEILAEGLAANPPPVGRAEGAGKRGRLGQTKAKNLLDRLEKYEDQVLRFALDFEVPFDNNQAERDLRMMKLKQKISGGFRSAEGADYFCRLRSYVSTMRKQGKPMLEALEAIFMGEPVIPSLQAE